MSLSEVTELSKSAFIGVWFKKDIVPISVTHYLIPSNINWKLVLTVESLVIYIEKIATNGTSTESIC